MYKRQSKEGRIERLFAGEVAAADAVRGAYMEALSREPTELQSQRLTEIIESVDSAEQRRLVLEDLYWSLLTSKEFIFNH